MCRSIKTLRSLEPQASTEDIHAAALQFVRKISGYRAPSVANRPAFEAAVAEVAAASEKLLASLQDRRPEQTGRAAGQERVASGHVAPVKVFRHHYDGRPLLFHHRLVVFVPVRVFHRRRRSKNVAQGETQYVSIGVVRR